MNYFIYTSQKINRSHFNFQMAPTKNLRVWIPAIFKGGGGANKKLERLPGNVNFRTKGHIETGLQKHTTS